MARTEPTRWRKALAIIARTAAEKISLRRGRAYRKISALVVAPTIKPPATIEAAAPTVSG